MKKILIHPELKKQIAKQFKVSAVTVDMSLQYVFNSPKAKGIRLMAKELLQKEIDSIVNE